MKKTILLADDDACIRTMVGRVLCSEGYQVRLAKNGREAASQFIINGPPDLVLLDLNMPDKDGWEAFRLMNTLAPYVPVIIITARPHQYQTALRMHIDALMEKPLDLTLLLQAIERLLAQNDQERLRRIDDREFKTALLTQGSRRRSGGAT